MLMRESPTCSTMESPPTHTRNGSAADGVSNVLVVGLTVVDVVDGRAVVVAPIPAVAPVDVGGA